MKLLVWFWMVCVGITSVAFAQLQERGDANSAVAPAGGGFGYGPGGAGGSLAGAMPSNAIFDAIDADHDGEITTRELRKAVAALKKLDTDKDGKITRAETLNNQAAPQTTNMPAGFGGQGGFRNGNNAGFSGDPRPGGPNLQQFDRNGDGQLSADEVPTQMRGMLRGADQNGDGRLDASEVQAIQQRVNERARGDRPLPPGVSVGPQGVSGVPK
jgi:Ca2+-binding EF-hand superfamily protein